MKKDMDIRSVGPGSGAHFIPDETPPPPQELLQSINAAYQEFLKTFDDFFTQEKAFQLQPNVETLVKSMGDLEGLFKKGEKYPPALAETFSKLHDSMQTIVFNQTLGTEVPLQDALHEAMSGDPSGLVTWAKAFITPDSTGNPFLLHLFDQLSSEITSHDLGRW